jgi:hypothetical protein
MQSSADKSCVIDQQWFPSHYFTRHRRASQILSRIAQVPLEMQLPDLIIEFCVIDAPLKSETKDTKLLTKDNC